MTVALQAALVKCGAGTQAGLMGKISPGRLKIKTSRHAEKALAPQEPRL
jgi:hypothetical protein